MFKQQLNYISSNYSRLYYKNHVSIKKLFGVVGGRGRVHRSIHIPVKVAPLYNSKHLFTTLMFVLRHT